MKNNNDLINAVSISDTTEKLYFTCSCLAIVILAIDLVIPLGIAVGVAYVGVVLVSLKSPETVLR